MAPYALSMSMAAFSMASRASLIDDDMQRSTAANHKPIQQGCFIKVGAAYNTCKTARTSQLVINKGAYQGRDSGP